MKIKNEFFLASCYFLKNFVYRLYKFFGFIFILSPRLHFFSKSPVKLKIKKLWPDCQKSWTTKCDYHAYAKSNDPYIYRDPY